MCRIFHPLESNLLVVDKIDWLIEDCKRYGTLPFAGIARAAFVAVQFLKSFVELDILYTSEYEQFMNSLNTVSKQLNNDLCLLFEGNVSKQYFLDVYGHLRPGTYDILSPRYDEAFEMYFSETNLKCIDKEEFYLSQKQINKIDKALSENGFHFNTYQLTKFIREAIEGREYSKLIFTKSLSKILSLIKLYGKKLDISKEDLSFLDGKNFDNMYMTSFIQLTIDRLMSVKAVYIQGGWLEIDAIQDLEVNMV